MRTWKIVVVALAAIGSIAPSWAESPATSPLEAFAPFIGAWKPDPASDQVRTDPKMADFVAFLFEWTADDHKLVRFYEGIPAGDLDQRILESIVAADPRTGELAMLGYQARNDFLYRGSFEIDGTTLVRLYDVTYPPDQEFRDPEDAERGVISYRDTCVLLDPTLLECRTERRRDGTWAPWGTGEPYRLVRASDD